MNKERKNMSQSVLEILRGLGSRPFIVEFVSVVTVERADPIIQIDSILILVDSESSARNAAQSIAISLSDRYRNSNGAIVSISCKGIHSIEELDCTTNDGHLMLSTFQFSSRTRIENLINGHRDDLPLLDS